MVADNDSEFAKYNSWDAGLCDSLQQSLCGFTIFVNSSFGRRTSEEAFVAH